MLQGAQSSCAGVPRPRLRVGIVIASSLALVLAPAAFAGGATVTRGDFGAFATGIGMPIAGNAVMVRMADGRTYVRIHAEGLAAGVTYASHVHAQACADGAAGGHYRFDPAGAATPPNEIWPGPFTTNRAGIGNSDTFAAATAGPGAVSVVIHGPTGAKIACADLE